MLSVPEAFDDFVLSVNDLAQVHLNIVRVDAPLRASTSIMGHLRASHHRLRGRAALVDASAAEMFALDKGNFPAMVSQLMA